MACIEVHGLCKAYAGPVLRDIDLVLQPGEVRVLAGENGAGKSTLSKILCGLATPDGGRMRLAGEDYAPRSRKQAEGLGVRIVLQELALVNTLSIAENLFLRDLPRRFGLIDYGTLNARASALMTEVGLGALDPATPVALLGIGQRQMVEIAATLNGECRLLVLDEPTAMLSGREVDLLFGQIARLKARGVAILYISHRLEETRRIADSISVLRDGILVATRAAADFSTADMVRLMVGRDVGETLERVHCQASRVRLKVRGLARGTAVRKVDFEVHAGEIFGIAGLVGSGRTETLRMLFGADRADAGSIEIDGVAARLRSPRDALRLGVCLVSEDRKEEGLLLSQPVSTNTTLADIGDVARAGWLRRARERTIAERIGAAMSLRAHSVEQQVGELSGGNQQKVAIGRWLHKRCDIMLFDEPTRGIDVGAKFDIYQLMADLAAQGCALVVVSSDLAELRLLCDRIGVMSAGTMVRVFARADASQDALLDAAFSHYNEPTLPKDTPA